jgi:hypothetical protein
MIYNIELVEVPNSERLFINIVSRQPHSFGPIRALLDTGSPTTIVSARDAIRLKIPISGAETGFGRGQIPSKRIKSFKFALKSEDNNIKYLEMPVNVVDIAALKSMHQDFQNNALQIPTIIGMDFLRFSKMKLFVDLASHKAKLEE